MLILALGVVTACVNLGDDAHQTSLRAAVVGALIRDGEEDDPTTVCLELGSADGPNSGDPAACDGSDTDAEEVISLVEADSVSVGGAGTCSWEAAAWCSYPVDASTGEAATYYWIGCSTEQSDGSVLTEVSYTEGCSGGSVECRAVWAWGEWEVTDCVTTSVWSA